MAERLTIPVVHEQVDIDDAVKGWAGWWASRGDNPRLYSPDGQLWRPRRAAIARCSHGCPTLEIPGRQCSCGLVIAREPAQVVDVDFDRLLAAYAATEGDTYIVGRVAGWGKLVEGVTGWRASRAYPIELWVPYNAAPLVKPLKAAYGCEVILKNFNTGDTT